MNFYLQCERETNLDNYGQQWTISADKTTVIYYKYPHSTSTSSIRKASAYFHPFKSREARELNSI